ncbi:uncharacterized protein LOC111696157 [Eurytemora carolleeae]|uniref:uncharacterized protein LOC111696157 n=1 Tax=Eurytemora carolleeae TaxID=1294199 RepID=UPI000C7769F5|nr:uncharacterized protein LOC111696157 [Eurytemora carolleeae]|eukprot:XP_023321475.1 uncharacterized protein LOC111696157 [Eurytemora affinis]
MIEFVLAVLLALYMVWFGIKEIERDKNVYCDVHGVYYECSGIPQQFYLSVLLVALGLLALYLLSTFSTIAWLLCPCWGKLARMMRAYSYELKAAAVAEGKENTSARILMGEMYEIYYNNRDLRLLLDLLAATSGLAPCLRVMALLDKSFRVECQPIIHSLERKPSEEENEDEDKVVLVFSESPLARHIFGKMDAIQCMYTVQIVPRTDKDSVEVVVFTKEDELKFFSYFHQAGNVIKPGDLPRKKFFFHGVDKDTAYTIKVSLVLNGRAIATAQKKIKAVIIPIRDIQSAQATIIAASYLNLKDL